MGDRFPCTDEQVYKNKRDIMEADNNDLNNEIDEYIKKVESVMWKGLVFFVIVLVTAVLLWLIVHKPLL